jgi:quinohemoprotein ethanol dehydrogenase
VPGSIRTSVFERFARQYRPGSIYTRGSQEAARHTQLNGTFTAIDSTTNKIAWQHRTPYRMGGGSGSTVTAGGLLLRGEPDGNFVVLDAKTGEVLWKFQTGFGADAPPVVYEVDGEQYIAIVTGGNSIQRSATGDAVWAFSLKGKLGPSWWAPRPPSTNTGPSIWWRIWGAVSPLWLHHEGAEHLNEPRGQGAQGDRGDR